VQDLGGGGLLLAESLRHRRQWQPIRFAALRLPSFPHVLSRRG
jgi:hypothetical protein